MPDISKELNAIMSARYGKDVRQSVHDGIEKVNNNLDAVGVDNQLRSVIKSDPFLWGYNTLEKISLDTKNKILTLESGVMIFGPKARGSLSAPKTIDISIAASNYIYMKCDEKTVSSTVLTAGTLDDIIADISNFNGLICFVTSGYNLLYTSPVIVSEIIKNSLGVRGTVVDPFLPGYSSINKIEITGDTFTLKQGAIIKGPYMSFVNPEDQTVSLQAGAYIFIKRNKLVCTVSNPEYIGKAYDDFNGMIAYVGNDMGVRILSQTLSQESINAEFTISISDNIAEIITKAMQFKGAKVYIKPGEHDVIQEWKDFYGSTYFDNLSSGRGLELGNDIHIIGRSGAILKCHYDGTNDYVMSEFSLFNNDTASTGYIVENLIFDTKNIRYCIHDERGGTTVPYKVAYKRCRFIHDNSSSTWQNSRACIGGGLGTCGDVLVEDCIFSTVTSDANKDSLAYHNSYADGAQSSIVIKNCYCEGDSTIQLAAYGDSLKKTKVLVANCSVGSPIEIYDWSDTNNFEYFNINNEVRS